METNNFYVYLHIRKDNGEPFYVGKGKNNRSNVKYSRSQFWKNIVNKYGFDIILLEEGLTEKQSFELEKYWINRIGRRDLDKGPLVNLSDGGEGNSGNKWNEEQKENFSIIRKGTKPWNKGKKFPQIKGEKNGMYGKTKDKNPFYGKKHSEETRKKISESLKGIPLSEEHKKKKSLSMKGKLSGTKNPMYGKCGEDNPNSRLTQEQANEIRLKYIPYKYTIKRLSKEYGVSEPTIGSIIKGNTYEV